jgi:hypothetical protein
MSRYKVWNRPSITNLIRMAPSLDELQAFKLRLETDPKLKGASAATRRAWREAFNARHDEIRASLIIRPDQAEPKKLVTL